MHRGLGLGEAAEGVHDQVGQRGRRAEPVRAAQRDPDGLPADPVAAALVAEQVAVPADPRGAPVGGAAAALDPVPAMTTMPGA